MPCSRHCAAVLSRRWRCRDQRTRRRSQPRFWLCCVEPGAMRPWRRPPSRQTCSGAARMPEAGRAWRAVSLLALVAIWWGAAAFAGDPRLLPGPDLVLAAAIRATQSGALPRDVAITLARVAAAFMISMLIGVALW